MLSSTLVICQSLTQNDILWKHGPSSAYNSLVLCHNLSCWAEVYHSCFCVMCTNKCNKRGRKFFDIIKHLVPWTTEMISFRNPEGPVDWDSNNYCLMGCGIVSKKLKRWSQTDRWVSLNPRSSTASPLQGLR